ncbi:MAG: protein kinase domain-containing protein [Deltaproteobacteria bacterium]
MKCIVCNCENTDANKFCAECGSSLTGEAGLTGRLNPDTILENRYIIVKTLGRGGMGAVYMALDSRLNNIPVAIKEMSTRAVGGDLQAAIGAFKKEASMLISLRNPALPRILDFFSRGEDRWYLVMDYIEGHTLQEEANQRGLIPEAEVLDWACQLCEILDYLHKQNPPIIFRDLKPANIMLTPQGQIKLIDFGIARHFKMGSSADTTAYGSHGFAPPEQYGENQTSPSSDVYALGATLHYLLTGIDPGKNPFIFEPLSKIFKVSPALDRAIMKALELKAEDRPTNMQEMLALLSGGTARPVSKMHAHEQVTISQDVLDKSDSTNHVEKTSVKGKPDSDTPTSSMTISVGSESFVNSDLVNTMPMNADENLPKMGKNIHLNTPIDDNRSGKPAVKKPGKTRNIIIAICLLISLISGGAYAYKQSTKLVFHDAALENGVRKAINKPSGQIYRSDVKKIRELLLDGKGITNISALKNFSNLEKLSLGHNKIKDISALSGLTSLQYLDLRNNQINNINALSGLTDLQDLNLISNKISDISVLSNLNNLKKLSLSYNQLNDISALSGLINLKTLLLSDNMIGDISSLSGLTNLNYLSISSNQISDISSLSGLIKLQTLLLAYNQISDISALSGLTNLRELTLQDNSISNITALSELTNLELLYISDNSISDYSPVESYMGNIGRDFGF